MKKDIHPAYQKTQVVCSCGNTFDVYSTLLGTIKVEVCYSCHPFYTGKQKLIDSAGRVDQFERRRKIAQDRKKAKTEQVVEEVTKEKKAKTGDKKKKKTKKK